MCDAQASEMSGAKEFVDDYLTRHKENFDDFSNVDDCYADILHHLDAIEVASPLEAV